jgi:hypothetical protein
MTRISSKAYRDGARGQACTLRIAGVCTGGGEDTVFAHIRDSHTGGAIKASDTSGADACFACHEVFDRRARINGRQIGDQEWFIYALRGLQETIERRIKQGLLMLPADATETRRTSTAKPGKIAGRPMPKSSRKIPSRPMRAKK